MIKKFQNKNYVLDCFKIFSGRAHCTHLNYNSPQPEKHTIFYFIVRFFSCVTKKKKINIIRIKDLFDKDLS